MKRRTQGTQGLETLVQGLFDYAGMFPPASLELDAALWESARSPRLARPHIVGADLVVGADDLSRLDEERLRMAGFADTEAKVCVVGVDDLTLERTAQDISRHNQDWGGILHVVSLEVHGTTFSGTGLRAAAAGNPGVQLFLEPRMPDHAWEKNAPGVFRLLEQLRSSGLPVGLKVRGSGQTAVSAQTLGWLIPQVVTRGLPLKATAGLHHPIVEAQWRNHLGFVGLAAALRLRQILGDGIALDQVQHCVSESDPAAFSFDGELSWRGHAVTPEQLEAARKALPFSVGSCSLREPDDDMKRIWGAPGAA